MNNNNKKNDIVYYSRFNQIYEDPYNIFYDYISGKISISDFGMICKSRKVNPEFRSILYRIFIGTLPYDNPKIWKTTVEKQRETYYKKLNDLLSKNEYILSFIECHEIKGSKPYERLFELIPAEQKGLLSLIKLDIQRTFQEMDLFRNIKIKNLLIKILYVFSIDHPFPSYRQGMNEILATLFYSTFPSLRYNKYSKIQSTENNDEITNPEMLYYFLVDQEHFEADLYTVYSTFMSKAMIPLYSYNKEEYRSVKPTYDLKNLQLNELMNGGESQLMKRMKKIFYIYLKEDKEYFNFLVDTMEPSLFLLRWILCMLDREISLKNLVWIWDCILFYDFVEFNFMKKNKENKDNTNDDNEESRINFIDYICLSMIYELKNDTINQDSAIVMTKFLRFNNEKNLNNIMNNAYKYAIQFNGGKDLWKIKETNNKKNFLN
jgi:TBC1 domain family protein 5